MEFLGHFIDKSKKNDVNAASWIRWFGKDAPNNLFRAGLHGFCTGRFSTTFQ